MGLHGREHGSLEEANRLDLTKLVRVAAGTKEWALMHWRFGHDVACGAHTDPHAADAPCDGWRVVKLGG